MLKLDEKVIFEMKSGYSLLGLEDFDLTDKCLQFTNLGNIYISKVDCLDENVVDYIEYNYNEKKIKLDSEIDTECLNVIAEKIPFKIKRGEFETEINMDLIMVLDLDEVLYITNKISENIFRYKNDLIILYNGVEKLVGTLEHGEKRIVFNSGKHRYEFKFEDIEYYYANEERVIFRGYFYIDIESTIIREVKLLGNNLVKFFPENIFEQVSNNKKIGVLPIEDTIVFCRLSGIINKKSYFNKNSYLIRHENLLVIYEKKDKVEIICKNINSFSKIDFGDGYYIIYDGSDIYNIHLDKRDAVSIGIENLEPINNKFIGFTREFRPFFINLTDEYLNISKSNEDDILKIKKSYISDISVNESGIIGDTYVEVEIKYSDKFIRINLMRNVVAEISSDIFSDYQNSILDLVSKKEVYDNWIKSTSDMVIYNFLGHIYDLKRKYSDISEKSSLIDFVRFINELYPDIHNQIENLDCISVSMSEILYSNEKRFFLSVCKDVDISALEKLERIFFDIRNDIKMDLLDISKCIDNISFLILPVSMQRTSIRMLRESQIYQVEFFSKLACSKLNHLIYDLLPHYVSKIVKSVFESYEKLYENYRDIPEKELKHELVERIKSAHIFRQYRVDSKSNIIRKDIIEDLYSLVKFSSMKLDSEFYYTGGYR